MTLLTALPFIYPVQDADSLISTTTISMIGKFLGPSVNSRGSSNEMLGT